jgi:fatty-acid desaturase
MSQLDTHSCVPRIVADAHTDPTRGRVRWAPVPSLWIGGMTFTALVAGPLLWSWSAFAVFVVTSGITLCLGHSLGTHRRLVHNSYDCPLWLEYLLVWIGTLVGMAGPLTMMRTHDTRDWAQRQPHCHDYFAHRQGFWRDAWWQLHCKLQLDCPPRFAPEARVAGSRFYQWLERSWMWHQLPLAALLYLAGGWGFVVWGVCARVAVCVTGHWLVGHFAHRQGHQDYIVTDAGVQGYNVPLGGLNALLSMGECWHNNHHAYPGSAKLGLHAGQLNPGWWVLSLLARLGLVRNLRLPHTLPVRTSLRKLHATVN